MSIANLLDFVGDATDPAEDISPAFADAFKNSLAVRIPVRRGVDGNIIAYRFHSVQPPRGSRIPCDSEDVLLKQLDQANPRTQNLFTTSGSTGETRLEGGFISDCASVWQHTGDSALFDCIFRDINIAGCVEAFSLSAAAGCLFESVRIRGVDMVEEPVDFGIVLNGSGGGFTNTNAIINCKFTFIKECGVVLGTDQGVDRNMFGNTIRGCWFEDINGCAISLAGNVLNPSIENCYFEMCSDTGADLQMSPGANESVRDLVVQSCTFGNASDGQRFRVDVSGNCSARFADNHVSLGDMSDGTPRVFMHLNTSQFNYELSNNYLQGSVNQSQLTYESRLFSVEPGKTPSISWDSEPSSDLVSFQQGPLRVFSGRSIAQIVDASTDTLALDAKLGHTFRLSGSNPLRLITDGYPGQQILLLANEPILITDDSTVPRPTEGNIELVGNRSFSMTIGSTLSLVFTSLGGNTRWFETGRTVA